MNLKNTIFKIFRAGFSALIIFGLIHLVSCGGSSTSTPTKIGDWVRKSDYEGVTRSGAVGFVINDFAYVGLGFGGNTKNTPLQDFWQYDASKDTWKVVAPFPGIGRSAAVAFSVNGKGYAGTGYDPVNQVYLKDFWEYDPISNSWTQVADFGGADTEGLAARSGAIAFTINNIGYVGTGTNGSWMKDFWAYDPVANIWTQMTSVGGYKRTDAFAFVIDGKGYVGSGANNGSLNMDFWEYTPESDTWTVKNDLQDDTKDTDVNDKGYAIAREKGTSFVINGKGYVCLGDRGSNDIRVWEYTPGSDTWVEKSSFEGSGRQTPVGFAIGNMGYVTTGLSGSLRFDDIWQFDPTVVQK